MMKGALSIATVLFLGTIAGCGVSEGMIRRSAQVRLVRDSVQIYQGRLASLRTEDGVVEIAYDDAARCRFTLTMAAGQIEPMEYHISWHLQDARVAMRNDEAMPVKIMERNEWQSGVNVSWRIAKP